VFAFVLHLTCHFETGPHVIKEQPFPQAVFVNTA
jgi:hypothetical protein